MPTLQISLKKSLRRSMREILRNLPLENRNLQSKRIACKILLSDAFKNAKRISVYLNTEYEVDTIDILQEMFKQDKQVFVPTYDGQVMEMVRLNSMNDFDTLPMTKWNIKQPSIKDNRENALITGGLDLFLIPGVAFTRQGDRLGHGKGYYDKYITRHFHLYPKKYDSIGLSIAEKIDKNKTILMGLAFKEQIVDELKLAVEPHDVRLDLIVTSD